MYSPMSVENDLLELPPLSLYVHVPWCVRKCPYCDFNSHAQQGELPEESYLQALLVDIQEELPRLQGRKLKSIFIGGGTPSLMSGRFYRKLLCELQQQIGFGDEIEITLEANPGTFEQEKFGSYLEAGINRLSLGIQSFSDQRLQALGRIHSAEDAYKAVLAAKALGFKRLNIDLMHGLPAQTVAQALDDLHQGLELGPSHLSWYQLTIEPNTEFHSRPPRLPEDETLWDIQEQGQQMLAASGFQQYEVSAYARPDQQSRHNYNYWRFGDYVGVGAGAHGKMTDLSYQRVTRRWKIRQPKAYMAAALERGSPVSGEEVIASEALPLEFMMNVLRLQDGVEADLFSRRTGQSIRQIESAVKQARERGLMVEDPQRLAPTEQGRRFLNDLLELFF